MPASTLDSSLPGVAGTEELHYGRTPNYEYLPSESLHRERLRERDRIQQQEIAQGEAANPTRARG